MIQANVSSTQTMVNQRATEIRFKELTLFTDNLGVIASLAAFFAETSLDSLYIEPETVAKDNPKNSFSVVCWSLSAVTISLNLLTLLVSIYTMLHGPALAIRGPAGSMPLAVSRIFVQRKIALRLFWAGVFAKAIQACALAAWRYPPVIAASVSSVFVLFVAATAHCIRRVTKKFSFRRFGLRREDFIEISYFDPNESNNPLAVARSQDGDVKSGWLMKQTNFFKRWNTRYFELTAHGELKWSTNPGAPTPKGKIDLKQDPTSDITVVESKLDAPGIPPYGFTITRRDAYSIVELVIAAESSESRARWIRAILNARARSATSSSSSPSPLIDSSSAPLISS